MKTINFCFASTTLYFCFNSAKFGDFFAHFRPFGAISRVGVRFKKLFETFLCRQSILVLEVQSYLFVFNSGQFGTILHFFGPFRGCFLPFGVMFGAVVQSP